MINNPLPSRYIEISIATQRLDVIEEGLVLHSYMISTARNGTGQQKGSECTPLGWHKVRVKIGAEKPINSVFIGRRPTGEVYTETLGLKYPERDWVLSRILWLCGTEVGFNRHGDVDSALRYIYIHGCPDHLMQGLPESHGCIRMKNKDIVALFECIKLGEAVLIYQ